MGEMADYDIEQGALTLVLHEVGECGEVGICPYCEAEVDKVKGNEHVFENIKNCS